jgi:hypothetical protein
MLQTGQYLLRVLPLSHIHLEWIGADFQHFLRKAPAMDHRELTLADLLASPITRALMAADRVDPSALEAALRALARKLELAPAAERTPPCPVPADASW